MQVGKWTFNTYVQLPNLDNEKWNLFLNFGSEPCGCVALLTLQSLLVLITPLLILYIYDSLFFHKLLSHIRCRIEKVFFSGNIYFWVPKAKQVFFTESLSICMYGELEWELYRLSLNLNKIQINKQLIICMSYISDGVLL